VKIAVLDLILYLAIGMLISETINARLSQVFRKSKYLGKTKYKVEEDKN